jgi:hypothetical protein
MKGSTAGVQTRSIWREDWPWLKRWRRRFLAAFYRLPDRGWFGMTPLELHAVICGFPRSGTTLLQLALQFAHPQARGFRGETDGWRAATYCYRNHRVLFSKVPADLFELDRLRAFYRTRSARLRVLAMVRDPRDQLTSQHALQAEPYQSFETWRRYYRAFTAEQEHADVHVVSYEDLVADPTGVQKQIEAFLELPPGRPFTAFHTANWNQFDLFALNGLRPIDATTVGRWKHATHRPRISAALHTLPQLPQALIDLGYELDKTWLGAYQGSESPAS